MKRSAKSCSLHHMMLRPHDGANPTPSTHLRIHNIEVAGAVHACCTHGQRHVKDTIATAPREARQRVGCRFKRTHSSGDIQKQRERD